MEPGPRFDVSLIVVALLILGLMLGISLLIAFA